MRLGELDDGSECIRNFATGFSGAKPVPLNIKLFCVLSTKVRQVLLTSPPCRQRRMEFELLKTQMQHSSYLKSDQKKLILIEVLLC